MLNYNTKKSNDKFRENIFNSNQLLLKTLKYYYAPTNKKTKKKQQKKNNKLNVQQIFESMINLTDSQKICNKAIMKYNSSLI